jgi:hypothetical protein
MTFLMMSNFQEIGFRVQSTRFMGLGERVSDFMLKPGNYSLMASMQDFTFDQGSGSQAGYGVHPFVII